MDNKNSFASCLLSLAFTVSPLAAEPLDSFYDCAECPVMIELPLGEFMMGAPEDEFRRRVIWRDGGIQPLNLGEVYPKTDEGPQGLVTIDIPIAMGRDEVTYDQWTACVDDGGCGGYRPKTNFFRTSDDQSPIEVGGNYPVLYVSYHDALLYIDWLNSKVDDNSYRLPTEAEWEYAARAGTTSRFAQGDALTSEQANFSGDFTEKVLLEEFPDLLTRGGPVPVDELDAANAWGLRHMSGNASEMVFGCYNEVFKPHATSSEWLGNALAEEESCQKISTRGGSYVSPIDILRVAWRSKTRKDWRTQIDGFRVAKELE